MNRAMLRFMGFRDKDVDQVEHDVQGSRLSARDRAALDFARALSRSNPRPARTELDALTAAGFGALEIVGIAQAASGMCGSNRLATMLAIPPLLEMEEAARNPFRRFQWSLSLKMMAKAMREPTLPAVPDGALLPCQAVLDAVSQTAQGREFRHCMYQAWESDVVPKRAKGLMFAVVARALSCPTSEQDARRLLVAEGMAPEAIEEVLSTLDSAELSDLERELVSFARDSVRYQAPAIQERTREMARGRSQPEILETVLIASLANCHTRMGCLLQVD
jgi:alkylhydroperoxidase family enzyme